MTRVGDLTVGVCNHGRPCCPHACVGIHITGSPNVDANGKAVTRVGDFSAHTCPHCGINMNVQGSPNVDANGKAITRRGDRETEFCGGGISVTGSSNVLAN